MPEAGNAAVRAVTETSTDEYAELDSYTAVADYGSEDTDLEIARRFAPVFYQGLGNSPRYDYITNFDFDGDWRGNNNWENAADPRFPLRAYIYYSVAETATHYFVHYAVFHPRDYKGGKRRGRVLSNVIEAGVRALGHLDPSGRAADATLAHENDLEGCLVVAEKRGAAPARARVVFVETLSHNRFLKYTPRGQQRKGFDTVRLTGSHPELYIEARGHGIRAREPGRERGRAQNVLVYRPNERADDPEKRKRDEISYALVPLRTTLWARALNGRNEAYAETHDYSEMLADVMKRQGRGAASAEGLNEMGAAFRGGVGGTNMARAPWGWFDGSERSRPLGEWFFDPAATIKRHFRLGQSFSTAYTHAPAVGITR